jgi:UDP-N-acetylmuramyl pentapeptide phosphotransferase/UDP-N-acetylglucosamine-1-phosphate transferase
VDVVPLAVAALVAALIAPAGLRALPTRENWLGREIAFPAGVLAATASILALGLLAALEEAFDRELLGGLSFAVLLLGVAFLGLADDLLSGPARGWRGHARALRRGEASTGLLKAAGTLALAVAVLAGGEAWLLSVLVVVTATNLFNILDLRPGRSVKVFVVLGAGLAIAGEWRREIGLFAGPLLVMGVYDLRMRAMLGDTGSNLLGALAGLWLVLALGVTGEAIALALMAAVTVYGEVSSITRTIDSVGPLRRLDRLGRPQ